MDGTLTRGRPGAPDQKMEPNPNPNTNPNSNPNSNQACLTRMEGIFKLIFQELLMLVNVQFVNVIGLGFGLGLLMIAHLQLLKGSRIYLTLTLTLTLIPHLNLTPSS